MKERRRFLGEIIVFGLLQQSLLPGISAANPKFKVREGRRSAERQSVFRQDLSDPGSAGLKNARILPGQVASALNPASNVPMRSPDSAASAQFSAAVSFDGNHSRSDGWDTREPREGSKTTQPSGQKETPPAPFSEKSDPMRTEEKSGQTSAPKNAAQGSDTEAPKTAMEQLTLGADQFEAASAGGILSETAEVFFDGALQGGGNVVVLSDTGSGESPSSNPIPLIAASVAGAATLGPGAVASAAETAVVAKTATSGAGIAGSLGYLPVLLPITYIFRSARAQNKREPRAARNMRFKISEWTEGAFFATVAALVFGWPLLPEWLNWSQSYYWPAIQAIGAFAVTGILYDRLGQARWNLERILMFSSDPKPDSAQAQGRKLTNKRAVKEIIQTIVHLDPMGGIGTRDVQISHGRSVHLTQPGPILAWELFWMRALGISVGLLWLTLGGATALWQLAIYAGFLTLGFYLGDSDILKTEKRLWELEQKMTVEQEN